MSEAKTKAIKEIGRKILTPKQMLQRLPIALAKVKGQFGQMVECSFKN